MQIRINEAQAALEAMLIAETEAAYKQILEYYGDEEFERCNKLADRESVF